MGALSRIPSFNGSALRKWRVRPLTNKDIVGEFGEDHFAARLKVDGWSVFRPDKDPGVDLVAAKNWAIIKIQVKSSTAQSDDRYGFNLVKFERDPRLFFVFCAVESPEPPKRDFFIVPSPMMERVPRFKQAMESATFKKVGKYKWNVTASQLRDTLSLYKNERGLLAIQMLSDCETLENYLQFVKSLAESEKSYDQVSSYMQALPSS